MTEADIGDKTNERSKISEHPFVVTDMNSDF